MHTHAHVDFSLLGYHVAHKARLSSMAMAQIPGRKEREEIEEPTLFFFFFESPLESPVQKYIII